MKKVTVAVIRSNPHTVLEDISRLMELAGFRQALDPSSPTILKDNISWHFPFLGANTTPWQLEGVIQTLQDAGYGGLVAVENDTVVTNAFKGDRLNKYGPIYARYQVPVKYNFRPEDIRWVRYEPLFDMKGLPQVYPEGIFIPEFFMGKNIVHLPTVKCHIYTTTTGAMKNAFGGLLNRRRHHTHSVIHETLVDLLAIQKEIHAGIFAVMDGTICGCGPGPRTMIPVEKNYLLASADCVAIDAVAAHMMGFDPMQIGYIRMAHERGLGVGNLKEIEIVGEDISSVNFRFHVGDNLASRAGDLLWFSPLKKMQKLFFQTPLVYFFVFGSYIYHDFIWWPLKGKRIMAQLRETSQWARLFDQYPEDIPEAEPIRKSSPAASGESEKKQTSSRNTP
ncbi:MAG: DUF362 domain-containing protein [Deltaproteobacteria bacterium]|nr:DUF362 domain-containing protein [Deltaproteobacteria bacterium]